MPGNGVNTGWLKPFSEIRRAVESDPVWSDLLGSPDADLPTCGIHLAVFVEPFLGYILDGSKTVESRFSVKRCAPFGRVVAGDVILLKQSSGPIVGLARVQTVWSYHLDAASWDQIRKQFTEALRAQDPAFWDRRRGAAYATLMRIDQVRVLDPIWWEKKDRRGWVVVGSRNDLSLFRDCDEP
jgi:hypothetical protein